MDKMTDTMMIDPMRNAYWVYDNSERHTVSQQRGHENATSAYNRALNWERSDAGEPVHYTPSSRELDKSLKYTNPPTDRHCPGFDGPRLGLLPAVTAMVYDNSLPNKANGDIAHEMRESERRLAHRLFDTTGNTR